MRRHTLVRNAIAAVTALGIAAAVAPLATAPAFAADAPAELTVPAERTPDYNATVINGAGETGYLSGWTQSGFHWTSYADGSTAPVVMPQGKTTAWGTGTDLLVLTGKDDTAVVQRNMKDGSERTLPLPKGQLFAGTFGDVVVTDGPLGMRLLTWADGEVKETPVGGVGGELHSLYQGNKDGMFVQKDISGMTMICWLGRDGLARTTHLQAEQFENGKIEVGGDRAVQWTKDGKATVWKTSDFWASTDQLTIGGYETSQLLGAVGDNVLVARRVATGGQERYSSLDYKVVAVPLKGGPERVVLEKATAMARFKPDGTMLIGAVVDGHQGVYAVGSALDVTKVRESPALTSVPTALALAQGRLNTVDRVPGEDGAEARLRGIDLSVTGPLTAGQRTDRGAEATGDTPEIQATGDGRLVYRLADGTVKVLDEGAKLPARTLAVKADELRVSGRYAATHRQGEQLKVTDLDTGSVVYTGTGTRAFALSGSTLWTGTEPGDAQAVDVRTGKATGKKMSAPCLMTSLQAQGGDVYWECDRDKSGVYDTAAAKNIELPAHQGALLGDGYVAWQKDGELSVTDLRGATGTHKVGKPAVAKPGQGWTVDRFGGAVAYVDAAGDTHVAPSGVQSAPVRALDEDFPATVDAKSAARTVRWWASKPLVSWDLALVDLATRNTVRMATGQETRGQVRLDWDGKNYSGQDLPAGKYAWYVTAVPADGGPDQTFTTPFEVKATAAAPRDYVGADGLGDLLAVTPAGVADFRAGGGGKVDAKVSGSGWTGANEVSAAVPFDDVDGDGKNDVLVRLTSGELRAYKPAGKALTPSTPYAKIGSGWNIFGVLTSPGDMTGDGRADLVAREASTGDLYLYEANGSGNFKSRVKIGTGFQNYLVASGAGDVNGDGRADLLARDAAGVLWLYPSTGGGTLATRVKIGGGWQVYNALVGAGDLNGDGKPDLLARGTDGVLWAYPGDGKGNFGGRVQVGGGWQMYKFLF
ncbi:FG-GAP-like repeat-containing protein [Streptomyces melanogenes]|uniref:FG-GAP-like repeat-containing protein n=1 Tax=Streptomyces melanogenes TaxID=67326 RepID=A0ABZ1XLN6_9ACTN|nr:FG-GAP-like repeat-containing protein [Streptomyces melanogenes]